MNRTLIFCACALALAACDNGEQRGLQQELAQLTKDARGKVDPLPQIKPYKPVSYTSAELIDPFSVAKIAEAPKANEKGMSVGDKLYQFHKDRPKEPLEAYPLDNLKMVGTLQQKGRVFGLVKADQALYRVKVGNYMGQNYGVVTRISDSDITLKELIQDGSGDWSERVTTISLQEAEAKK